VQKLFILFPVFFPSVLFAQNAVDSANAIDDAQWSFDASGYYYFVHDNNTLMLTGSADHKSLHLETRYNYEDENSISVFAGWTFQGGKKIQFDIKPMVGIFASKTRGFVPALETSISYKCFDLYIESECVFDMKRNNTKENDNNYFYTWQELAITPVEWLRTGIAGQATYLFRQEKDIQKGIFAEYSFWKFTAGVHYFISRSTNNYIISSLSVEF
jgi:hypothetical protein